MSDQKNDSKKSDVDIKSLLGDVLARVKKMQEGLKGAILPTMPTAEKANLFSVIEVYGIVLLDQERRLRAIESALRGRGILAEKEKT